jgi:hypothetical protein
MLVTSYNYSPVGLLIAGEIAEIFRHPNLIDKLGGVRAPFRKVFGGATSS